MQDHQMLYTMTSAGSTSSEAPTFSRRGMKKSLADELEGDFEDVSLSPGDLLERTESPNDSREEIMEDIRRVEDVIPEEGEQPTASAPAKTALRQPARKTNFIGHTSPLESTLQPKSLKEHTTLMASKHNRELIDRNADGFFNMETMPTINDVQRRVQQSKGIAALQRTLAPATTLSDAASPSTGSSHARSSTAGDSAKRPSTLRQVTFVEPKGRRSGKVEGPYPHTAGRTQAASRFSLGRHLVAAGHMKKLPEPSAPARFVKLPMDPVVNFKRNFSEFGLKITIPEPEPDECEDDDSGSTTSIPDVDSAGDLQFKPKKHPDSKAHNGSPRLGNGVTRVYNPNHCLEPSCPIKWAHAKGPYHHMGDRHNKIMTGLFGHSNPPPEIWNAYCNMIHLTCDGEVLSPDGRPESKAEEDLVIAFAMFHFGGLNGISGKEFHQRYAGRHMSSRVGLQSSSTTSSAGSCCSGLGIRK